MIDSSLYFIPLLFLCLLIPVFLYRVIKGPTTFDRLIGLSGISTKAILILVMIGVVKGNLEMFIDIGIAYGLLNLVGTLAISKYLESRGI